MIVTIPIAKTQVDWPTFLKYVYQALGRKISNLIDIREMDLSEPMSFIYALAELEYKKGIVAPSQSKGLLCHFSFSMLVLCDIDTMIFIVTKTSMNITFNKEKGFAVAVLTGDVQQWKDLVDICEDYDNKNIQKFSSNVKSLMLQNGFSLWSEQCKLK